MAGGLPIRRACQCCSSTRGPVTARPRVPGWPSGRGKRGLLRALAAERSAEIGRLAAEAARSLGCGGAGLEAAEAVIRAGMLKLGGGMLGQLLAADPGHRGPRVPCGQGHEAEFVSYRDKVIDTVLGPVTLTRAWYHCAACGHGLAPRDAELGVAGNRCPRDWRAMNDQAAAAGPFAKAAGLLEDLAGVRLTAKRVERAAEASGAAQAAAVRGRGRADHRPQAGAAAAVPAAGQALRRHRRHRRAHDREGDRRAATARARTAAPAPARSSSPSSSPRTSSMTTGYPVRDRDSSSYIATFEPAAVFADLVEAEGIRRGADHVRQLTILGDGAAWICYPDVGIADLIPVPRLSRGA